MISALYSPVSSKADAPDRRQQASPSPGRRYSGAMRCPETHNSAAVSGKRPTAAGSTAHYAGTALAQCPGKWTASAMILRLVSVLVPAVFLAAAAAATDVTTLAVTGTVEQFEQALTSGNVTKDDLDAALTAAVTNDRPELVGLLVDAGGNPNAWMLDVSLPVLAIRLEHIRVLGALLEHGADPDLRLFMGWTALHHAVVPDQNLLPVLPGEAPGWENVPSYAPGQNIPAISTLVRFGVDVNSRTDDGKTALHLAARICDAATVGYLLEQGADSTILSAAPIPKLARTAFQMSVESGCPGIGGLSGD